MNFKVGDKVKVLLAGGINFNNESDYEIGTIKAIRDHLGYLIEFDDKRFSICYYDIENLQKIENENNYISKDKIREKINYLESQFDEGIEDYNNQFIIDCVGILEELLKE